jgi:hypothetical protein
MAFTKATLTGTKDTIKAAWTKFNDLIDDLSSTANGLGGSQIGIEDIAGNMDADNLEDGLAEIYTDTIGSRTIANGFEEDSATTTGLTWGYQLGAIRDGNTVTDVVAGTIALSDDTVNYIQINESGTISKNTTGFTPDKVPLRQITTASGAQTVSTDKRCWFSTSYPALLRARGLPRAQFVWCESLDYDGGTVIFVEGETVTGAGGATGVVEHIVGDATSGTLYLTTRNSTAYVNNEALTGSGSGAATADGASSQNAVVLHPAAYHHSGTTNQIVYWQSKIAYEFANLAAADWSYLYLDDSAIVTANSPVITATQLIDATTEPARSFTKFGQYSGNDKCIFAVKTGSSKILEFYHSGEFVSYGASILDINDQDVDNAWADGSSALSMPKFSTMANVGLVGTSGDTTGYLLYRPNGSQANGTRILTATAGSATDHTPANIITDSSQLIELNFGGAPSTNLFDIYTNGWYFPTDV